MKIRNSILTILFLIFLTISAWQENLLREMKHLAEGRKTDDITDELFEEISYDKYLNGISSAVLKLSGNNTYYNNAYGINVTDEKMIVGNYSWTSTDYEVQQMQVLSDYLKEKEIGLLYVNLPAKYIDDMYYFEQFHGESYLNNNADRFLDRIGNAGIKYIDLREEIIEDDLDSFDLFYRTDHHWTVPAAKWATELIAKDLNEEYGYHIDLDIYDDRNFEVTEFKNKWIGEQGAKVGEVYVGRDDFSCIQPTFDTNYKVCYGENVATGSFSDVFIISDMYYFAEPDESLHYSYTGMLWREAVNENVSDGNILLLDDSFGATLMPFLSLGVHHVTHIQPRNIDFDIIDYIEENDFDMVIIAYTQSMLGARDTEGSANYNQFRFSIDEEQ